MRGTMPRCSLLCILVLGCTSDKGDEWGVPMSQPDDEPAFEPSGEPSSETSIPDTWSVGDAIQTVATYPDPPANGQIIDEWVDVSIYDENYAIQVGVSGVGLVSRSDGRVLDKQNPGRGYSVDSNGDLIVVGSRTQRVSLWRFQESERLSPAGFIDGQGVHEKVAVSMDAIAIAWRDQGLTLYGTDTENILLTQISGTDVYAVDICGSDLFYSDVDELVWMSIEDPTNPVERQRITVNSEVRDIECDDQYVALGLGGNGVRLLDKQSDLREIGSDIPPGSIFSVSLDGDNLWAATWSQTVLYSIGDDLLPLAHETPVSAAMAVAASNGQAVVADWLQSTILEQTPNVLGPEIHLPTQLSFRPGDSVSQSVWVQNFGAQPLELNFVNVPNGFSIGLEDDDRTSTTIEPRDTEVFVVSVPQGEWNPASIRWESNDPDESVGILDIKPALNSVGSLHPDFALPIVSSNGLESTTRLSDYQGKVLFLAWWSDY